MPNLRDILKSATAAEHAALEATGVLQAFTSFATTPAVYTDYLARQWRLHRLMEPTLRSLLDPAWAENRLVKSKWLEDDLETLGVRVEPCQIAWDAPCSTPEALGTMYVLEGATLGIRQSVRSLPAAHPAHGPANRFVQGYGEHTGARWKEVLMHLEEVHPLRWPDVIAGALAAFSAFRSHFSGALHAEFDATTRH